MPLPPGFKVNGTKSGASLVPPRVKKIIGILEKQPFGDLMGSADLIAQAELAFGSASVSHPALADYREKVDNKYFWGSKKSIARLREQLAEAEETHAKN
jgi:hypothetical protein